MLMVPGPRSFENCAKLDILCVGALLERTLQEGTPQSKESTLEKGTLQEAPYPLWQPHVPFVVAPVPFLGVLLESYQFPIKFLSKSNQNPIKIQSKSYQPPTLCYP